MNEIISKIKQFGYWRVIIRPTKYNDNLIPSLGECKKIIADSQVSLRGWNYPHIDLSGINASSNNSVHSMCDWPSGPMYEYWRLYQTGQFIHYFAMREDLRITEEKKKEFQLECGPTKVDKFLSILSTLYSVTEIFEFAARLFSTIGEVDFVEVIIELHGTNRRMLVFWGNFMRFTNRAYINEFLDGIIKIDKTISKNELINRSSDIALDVAIEIFKKFNWDGVNKQIFVEDQKKLLERRL